MLGTLNGALEVREIRLDPDAIMARVTGINEIVDGLPVLTRVEIDYRLRIPKGTREVVERALERHAAAASSTPSAGVAYRQPVSLAE